jgi:hypothetical protein
MGPETTQIEYKYTLGSWDFVEKGIDCEEIGNRSIILDYGTDGTQDIYDTVVHWNNIPPCEGMVVVTFDVMVPVTTPPDAVVYIAGSLSGLDSGLPDWDPAGVPLSKVGDFEWRVILSGPNPGSIEYKYTLGSWDSVEKGATCEEISNRGVVVTYGPTEVDDTVLNWANVAPCAD